MHQPPDAARPPISIHAPARGATGEIALDDYLAEHFNPRPREGGDVVDLLPILKAADISIHAPARGATPRFADGMTQLVFQSTPPRGGRLSRLVAIDSTTYFNPRPREGGDSFSLKHTALLPVFQSTPPRGGRHTAAGRRAAPRNFNPRPREGGDAF